MIIFFQELILQLFLWLLRLIDGTMELFSAISGETKVNYQGQEVNLLEFILGDSTVGTIFWCIFILAIGLTCIFTIVSLVKNMLSGARSVSGIVGKFGLSLLGTMAMLAVVVLGILISGKHRKTPPKKLCGKRVIRRRRPRMAEFQRGKAARTHIKKL